MMSMENFFSKKNNLRTTVIVSSVAVLLVVCVTVAIIASKNGDNSDSEGGENATKITFPCNVAPTYNTEKTAALFKISIDDITEKFGNTMKNASPKPNEGANDIIEKPFINRVLYTQGKFFAEVIYGFDSAYEGGEEDTLCRCGIDVKYITRWVLIDVENNTLSDVILDKCPVGDGEKQVYSGAVFSEGRAYSAYNSEKIYSEGDTYFAFFYDNEVKICRHNYESSDNETIATLENQKRNSFIHIESDDLVIFENCDKEFFAVNKETKELHRLSEKSQEFIKNAVFARGNVVYTADGKTFEVLNDTEGVWKTSLNPENNAKVTQCYVTDGFVIWSSDETYYMAFDGKNEISKVELPVNEHVAYSDEEIADESCTFVSSSGDNVFLKYVVYTKLSEGDFVGTELFFNYNVNSCNSELVYYRPLSQMNDSSGCYHSGKNMPALIMADDLYCSYNESEIYCGKI